MLVTIVGSGNATELGRFTDAQHHCIYANSLIFDKGQFVFTAADGDLLVGSYYGDLVPADNTGVLFEVQGHWVISGGTGRFANATGSPHLDVVAIGIGETARGIPWRLFRTLGDATKS